jgi:hypothetical protein
MVLAVGLVLGTFPVLGLATFLCAGAARALRLNAPALLAVNQLATPAQYALLLPCARVGARLVGEQPGVAGAAVQAVSGWLCLCVPAGAVLYLILAYALEERPRRSAVPEPAA